MLMAFVGKWRLSVDCKKAPPLGRLMTKWSFLGKDGGQVCLDAFLYPTEGGQNRVTRILGRTVRAMVSMSRVLVFVY